MEEKSLIEWINNQIEARYRAEVQASKNPRKVRRMSLRKLATAIGYESHAPLMRVSAGKGVSNDLLKRLADYFNVSEGYLFQLAGKIDDEPRSAAAEEVLQLTEQMDEEHRQIYLRIGKTLLERKIQKQTKKKLTKVPQ